MKNRTSTHLDPEEFHPHQQGNYALRRVRSRLFGSQFLQFHHETLTNSHKSGLRENPDYFGVQIRYYVYVSCIRLVLNSATNTFAHIIIYYNDIKERSSSSRTDGK